MTEENGENKIQNFVVLPELTDASPEKIDLNIALKNLINFIKQKTQESQKCMEAISPISFMANNLQNRQLCTEFAVQVAKFRSSEAASNQKLEQLASSDEEIANLVAELKNAWKEWEDFLEQVDKSVEQLAGPCSPKSVTSADHIKLANAKGKVLEQGTLLAYVQNSPFQMMFIEVVFSLNSCADHVLQIYEKQGEFQALSCDILLLTRLGDGGSGFLKLVGVPFRLILNEEQSLAKILQHRQSAVSISGQRAITMLAEIGTEPEFIKNGIDKNGGALLMDHEGNILYDYSCKEQSDWPSVEDILKEVKKNMKKTEPEKTSNGTSKDDKDTHVAVGSKKCCIIM